MRYDWNQYADLVQGKLDGLKVPGAAVCVSDDSGILFARGFGYCDSGRRHPVSPDTIFGIASMSKSITCLAAALLEQEGRLSLDDPVSKYLPAFRLPGVPRESVLVRHLCEHRTGLPPLPTLSWSMAWNTPVEPWRESAVMRIRSHSGSKVQTIDDIIEYIAAGQGYRLLGAPGEYMSYSNDGYALLSSVIDAAAGESLESYADRRIFAPLGMSRTTFDIGRAQGMGNITSLFAWEGERLHSTDHWDVAPPYRGCGWVKSTATDMCRYYLSLSRNGRHHGRQLWPQSCVERVIGRGFAELPQGVYCFGLNKRLFEDVAICEHSGGLTGVSSQGGFVKDGAFAVTVLTNLSGISCAPISNAAFNLWLGLPMQAGHSWLSPRTEGVEDPAFYAGEFVSLEELDEALKVTADAAGQLWGHGEKGAERLLFCGGSVFTPEGTGKLPPATALRFLQRGGECWGVAVGSRIYQKKAE